MDDIKWLKPALAFEQGDDPSEFLGAWGSGQYGKFVECPIHGVQFCTWRGEHFRGTTYRDGSYDATFHENLACGCTAGCRAYAGDPEIHRDFHSQEKEE